MFDLFPNIAVSRETFSKLEVYLELLKKWQKAVNLVGPSTLGDAWSRHILDSAQIQPYIENIPNIKVVADLGCGAGFPGLVLAMINPDLEVHLIESDFKKCQFMKAVSRETKTPVHVHCERIEDMRGVVLPDVVTARALAPVSKLLEFVLPWAMKNQAMSCLFLKGQNVADELAAASRVYSYMSDIYQSFVDERGAVVKIADISKK